MRQKQPIKLPRWKRRLTELIVGTFIGLAIMVLYFSNPNDPPWLLNSVISGAIACFALAIYGFFRRDKNDT
jgi:hypothetical protein